MQPAKIQRGTAFVRTAMLLMANGGDALNALGPAKQFMESTPEVFLALKGMVDSLSTGDGLVEMEKLTAEFIALMRQRTILGRLPFRRAPFLTRTLTNAAGLSAGWTGQGRPKAVGKLNLASVTLGLSKVTALVVISQELARTWTDAGEDAVRSELVRAIANFADKALIDPSMAAVPNVSPASVTYGVTPIDASGTTVSAITADLQAAARQLIDGGSDLQTAAWILNPRTALHLAALRNNADQFVFPEMSLTGGTLLGLPVLVSAGVPVEGSPGLTTITLIDPDRVIVADDGQAKIDTSTTATLQMDDDPQTGAQPLTSLWQSNLVGLRCERYLNFARTEAGAVAVISDVPY